MNLGAPTRCPHCDDNLRTVTNLDMHLRFSCRVLRPIDTRTDAEIAALSALVPA